jgi:hypothetical protein
MGHWIEMKCQVELKGEQEHADDKQEARGARMGQRTQPHTDAISSNFFLGKASILRLS